MNRISESRLNAIEDTIKAQYRQGVWIDHFDNQVRVDRGNKRGKIQVFNSVSEAAQYLTELIQQEEKVNGILFFSDILDLFPGDTELLKTCQKEILGKLYPLACQIPLVRIKDTKNINFAFIALAIVAKQYFSTVEFLTHYEHHKYTPTDTEIFEALFSLYAWLFPNEDHEKIFQDYCNFVMESGHLPMPAGGVPDELSASDIQKISAGVILQAITDYRSTRSNNKDQTKDWLLGKDCELYLAACGINTEAFHDFVNKGCPVTVDLHTMVNGITSEEEIEDLCSR